MENILYKSENIIPWDTQSAFKMNSYNTTVEENMVFCYMKAYVHKKDLVLCSYCFTEKPADGANMHLYLAVCESSDTHVIDYGFGGIAGVQSATMTADDIEYRTFKADDEQGFYWCGEITVKGDFIEKLCGRPLAEKSIVRLNLTQTFANGDKAALYGNAQSTGFDRAAEMKVFVVLDY